MFRCWNVQCDGCGAIEEDVLLTPEEEPEKCSECGSARYRRPFAPQSNPGAFKLFQPIDVGGGRILNSPVEVAAYKKDAAFGCSPNAEVYLEPDTKEARKVRIEERKHRAWERRKAKGVCEQQLREQAQAPNGRMR